MRAMSWTKTTLVSSVTRLHMEKDGRVDMDELANRAVSHACAYLGSIRERTVKATLTGDELRELLGGPVPVRGEDPIRVIDTIAEAGRTGTVASQGPR